MRILITSGGTREPIDDVRYVGNIATGSTGAGLAAEAVRRFHTVFLLSGVGSVSPPQWALDTGLLVRRTFSSTQSLLEIAEEVCATGIDAVVASAAVADFTPERHVGKLSSSSPEMVVRMVPTPKVIDHIRKWSPAAQLVAFKLETGVSQEELVARARRTMKRSGANYIVANDLTGAGQDAHPACILGREGAATPVASRTDLANGLLDLLEAGREE
jgi:phosphopantothenoylcysteine synthetase/decarboxylase